jgi:hypothetical protein
MLIPRYRFNHNGNSTPDMPVATGVYVATEIGLQMLLLLIYKQLVPVFYGMSVASAYINQI